MDNELQEKFKQKLLEEKKKLQARVSHTEESALEIPLRESIGELSMYDNHPADIGSETFERSKDLALREQMEIQLRKIDDALANIEKGSYGMCDICGAEIPTERLDAMPSTTVCKKCKEAEEHLPDRHPRPIEEDVVAPPFGGFMHDNSELELGDAEDEIMFDGEDAWQSVARFGTSETPQDISVHGVDDYNHMYLDADEDDGTVGNVEEIPYKKGLDGMFYKDFDVEDDKKELPQK